MLRSLAGPISASRRLPIAGGAKRAGNRLRIVSSVRARAKSVVAPAFAFLAQIVQRLA